MSTTSEATSTSTSGEFVALMAAMTSLAALATDAMLPALLLIGSDLGVASANANQLIVSLLFYGMALGQLFYGPVSDTVGRKPPIYVGYGLFIVGCLLSLAATTYPIMLAGRLLQGLGVAGPRSVAVALVRDEYEGDAMARVMSFVMTTFIIVPILAPSVGQFVLLFAGWRAIFAMFLLLAALTVTWFALRQPETLPPARRIPWSAQRMTGALREVVTDRRAVGYTLAAGLVSGAFLGYLNSAQQIFQVQYGLGARFPLYFATVAAAFGAAAYLNARFVMRFGMRRLANRAVVALSVLSFTFLLVTIGLTGQPPLWLLMAYFMLVFFCVGILFGNLNALAMAPLGHIAGVGAAVVGSFSLLLGAILGTFIGQSYNGTVLPLVLGFAILGTAATLVMGWAQRTATDVPSGGAIA